jgi:hypothetical protein
MVIPIDFDDGRNICLDKWTVWDNFYFAQETAHLHVGYVAQFTGKRCRKLNSDSDYWSSGSSYINSANRTSYL